MNEERTLILCIGLLKLVKIPLNKFSVSPDVTQNKVRKQL